MAHRTNLARGEIRVDGAAVDYRLTVGAHDLADAAGLVVDHMKPMARRDLEPHADLLESYFRRRIGVWSGDDRCPLATVGFAYESLPDDVVVTLDFDCPTVVDWLVVSYLAFFDSDIAHRSLGVVDTGRGVVEFMFDRSFTLLEVEVPSPAPPAPFLERLGRFLALGVEHIALGYDHILFLIALMLINIPFWRLVAVVTAFTAAHSITLSLAWFGFIDLPPRLVESLIALSIVYVAAENLWGRGFGHRWMVAFGFGLFHGLGFYGVLRDIEIARGDAVTALLGFNLGVEAGQLVIVALFYGALVWAARRPWYRRAMLASSSAIVLVAGFWFVERAFLVG